MKTIWGKTDRVFDTCRAAPTSSGTSAACGVVVRAGGAVGTEIVGWREIETRK